LNGHWNQFWRNEVAMKISQWYQGSLVVQAVCCHDEASTQCRENFSDLHSLHYAETLAIQLTLFCVALPPIWNVLHAETLWKDWVLVSASQKTFSRWSFPSHLVFSKSIQVFGAQILHIKNNDAGEFVRSHFIASDWNVVKTISNIKISILWNIRISHLKTLLRIQIHVRHFIK